MTTLLWPLLYDYSGLVWFGWLTKSWLVRMSYLKPSNPLLFNNIEYVGCFKHLSLSFHQYHMRSVTWSWDAYKALERCSEFLALTYGTGQAENSRYSQSCKMSISLHRLKFYPKKRAQIATNFTYELTKMEMIGYFWGERLKFYQPKVVLRQNLISIGRIYPKTTSIYKNVWSPKLFTPTFQ